MINIEEKDFKRKLIKAIKEHDGILGFSIIPKWDGCADNCVYELTITFKESFNKDSLYGTNL